MSTGYEGQVETHMHTFQVADLGDFDLDEDRSITSSIEFALKGAGIDAVVDGEEFNASEYWKNYRKNKKPHVIIHDYGDTGSSETRNQEETEEDDEK